MTNDAIRAMVREVRIKAGWTQLATAVGLGWQHQSIMSNLETGRQMFTLNILRRMADLYDMDLVIEFRPKIDERIAVLEGK